MKKQRQKWKVTVETSVISIYHVSQLNKFIHTSYQVGEKSRRKDKMHTNGHKKVDKAH